MIHPAETFRILPHGHLSPYMLAALAFKVGYIFGGISVLAVIFYFIFLPETKVSQTHLRTA